MWVVTATIVSSGEQTTIVYEDEQDARNMAEALAEDGVVVTEVWEV